jgi:hypothetical protein
LMDIQDPEVQAFALYLHLNKLEWTSIAYLLQTPETKAQHIQEYSAEEMVITTWYHFFFFGNPGCPGQLTRTTTNPRTHWTPCKPSRQVRHRGGDRRARWGSNPGDRGKETLPLPLGHKPRCNNLISLLGLMIAISTQLDNMHVKRGKYQAR